MNDELQKALVYIGLMFIAIGVFAFFKAGPCAAMIGVLGILMLIAGHFFKQ